MGQVEAKKKAEFEALFARHAPRLRAMLARRCAHLTHVEAEDVLQEVSVRLWRALLDERNIHNPASYLTRIAATALIDAIRRTGSREKEVSDETAAERTATDEAQPDALMEARQLAQQVDGHLANLAPNRRRALGLYLQGLNTIEIGRLCGWSEGKARNLAYRALAELKTNLKKDEDDVRSGT